MTPANSLDLSTTCPDGVTITTPWPEWWNPKSRRAQEHHDDWHLREVQAHMKYAAMLDGAA